jgi:pilus assembly protein CpaE
VLDLPHTFDPITVAALDLADDILTVLTLDIPGIRSANRALKVFNRLSYSKSKTHLVVNRWSKNIDIQLQKVEAHLDDQIMGLVPNDYRKVIDSINLGQPLVQTDPSSKISTEIRRIASVVFNESDSSTSQTKKGLLRRGVFGRQNNQATSPLQLSPMLDKA